MGARRRKALAHAPREHRGHGAGRNAFAGWQWRQDYNAWAAASGYGGIPTGASDAQARAVYSAGYAGWHESRSAQRYAARHGDVARGNEIAITPTPSWMNGYGTGAIGGSVDGWRMTGVQDGASRLGPPGLYNSAGHMVFSSNKVVLQVMGGTVGVAESVYDGVVGGLTLARNFAGAAMYQTGLSKHLGLADAHAAYTDQLGATVAGAWEFLGNDGRIAKVRDHYQAQFAAANALDAIGDSVSVFDAARMRSAAVFEIGSMPVGGYGALKTTAKAGVAAGAQLSDIAGTLRGVWRMDNATLGSLDFPVGPVGRVGGRGVVADSVSAHSGGAAFGGALYPSEKLTQLVSYLEKRGVSVYGTEGNPRFLARADGTGMMELPANPTALQVKHELSHYLDFKKLGYEAYRDMGGAGALQARYLREASVLDRLQQNRIWNQMNHAEKHFSINYVERLRDKASNGR